MAPVRPNDNRVGRDVDRSPASPGAGYAFDLPEVNSLLFALRRSGRRRIGEVGAERSHPHSRRRTSAARTKRVASLASHPSLPRGRSLPPDPAWGRRKLDKGRRRWRYAEAAERRHWNTWPSLHIACSTTASLRASATRALLSPTRWARRTAQTLSGHHNAASRRKMRAAAR